MKEIVFINRNAKQWQETENRINSENYTDPDELTAMFLQLTDDLSYARTYYSGSETEEYLNKLAAKTHAFIYKTKKEKNNRFLIFWKYEFPLEIYRLRKFIVGSAVVFLFFGFIGALSASGDQDFVRLILGDGYVNMTIENIEKGEPMAVYESMDSGMMFFRIAYNNIQVAMLTFVLGMLSYFGTGGILLFNGIMLGSFQYFFYRYNVLYDSILSIWIHGTIEIFAIIVAGAAGLILGNSIMFPKTYSRKESFRRGAKRGAKTILGLLPFIILAAFLEGYITRHTEWSDYIRFSIIGISLVLIIVYFIVYPIYLNKKLHTDIEFHEFYYNLFK
ncbi:MAG: stage II sporulation protein M [Bacteroidota bacterium]|nr:stage II sporulation protein M [Bacteroidota bacterium]